MGRFDGKVALITGASRGIGRGIALELAANGATIVVNYRSHADEAQAVADTIAQMGGRALVWQADVADRAALERMFAGVVEHFGQIDIVIANAGFSIREAVIDAQWEHVQRVVEVSQFGVFHTCQLAAQQMVKQGIGSGPRGGALRVPALGASAGKIVIISSIFAELATPTSAAYNMAKAAINHLARTLAAELAEHHINVNVINPGWIDTPGERAFATEAQIQAGAKRLPWGRLGAPEDIAKAVAFLVSDDADYITGATLRVDGGYVLGLRLPPLED